VNAVHPASRPGENRHRLTIALMACAGFAYAAFVAWSGFDYYRLPITERPFHPLHSSLRPAGPAGIRLGILSLSIFLAIYLYPLRKRIKFLQKFGQTRRWLDIHVLLGLTVPLIVTLHASLKLRGLIGMAYWIMIAIVVSGIVGRYLYSRIPRSVTAAELSLKELDSLSEGLSGQLHDQRLFSPGELSAVLTVPSREEVECMPLLRALVAMTIVDFRRPFRVAALRRKTLSSAERLSTLGGLLPSRHAELESVLGAIRGRAWLTARILFLNRAAEVFHLWHVVHRPFSYSFAIIVFAHITLVILMGYF